MVKKSNVQQNYPLAPIIEAVIDIRVLPQDGLNYLKLDQAIRKEYLKEYPIVVKQFQNEFQLKSGENPLAHPVAAKIGLRFISENNQEILQIKENGLTFSKLAPYECWEKFKEQAKYLWKIYQTNTAPQNINRIAVRFINRFDFPETDFELSDYLNVFPQFPEIQLAKGFSMQAILNQPDLDSTLIITQALLSPIKPHTVSILLDFDLFNETIRSVNDDFWSFLEQLRTRKNHFFENSITEKTRRLISKR